MKVWRVVLKSDEQLQNASKANPAMTLAVLVEENTEADYLIDQASAQWQLPRGKTVALYEIVHEDSQEEDSEMQVALSPSLVVESI